MNNQTYPENSIQPGATLGIMQPYFFPFTGYFSLVMATNEWIVFDPVQFIRHGWIERNRILKPEEGWQYVSVPLVKQSRETLITNTQIKVSEPWQEKIFRQLDHYRKRAPYYTTVVEFLHDCFKYETSSITKLNTYLLKAVCGYIGITCTAHIYSEMSIVHDEVIESGEWALHISKALNAKGYINPAGGVKLFNKDKFRHAGIRLQFLTNNLKPYNQRRSNFEAGLSIIDTMMFCSPEEIRGLVGDYELVE